jgi:hypothetical protein
MTIRLRHHRRYRLLFVGYGRVGQWSQICAKLRSGGRRPWLALRFSSLLIRPGVAGMVVTSVALTVAALSRGCGGVGSLRGAGADAEARRQQADTAGVVRCSPRVARWSARARRLVGPARLQG